MRRQWVPFLSWALGRSFVSLVFHIHQEFWAPALPEVVKLLEVKLGAGRPLPRTPSKVFKISTEVSESDVALSATQAIEDQLAELITRKSEALAWFYRGCHQDAKKCISVSDWVSGCDPRPPTSPPRPLAILSFWRREQQSSALVEHHPLRCRGLISVSLSLRRPRAVLKNPDFFC